MTWFEAICHAFGTMATGGFSTLNASLGGFNSKTIEYTVIVFMILAGTNFTLIYLLTLGNFRKFVTDRRVADLHGNHRRGDAAGDRRGGV